MLDEAGKFEIVAQGFCLVSGADQLDNSSFFKIQIFKFKLIFGEIAIFALCQVPILSAIGNLIKFFQV